MKLTPNTAATVTASRLSVVVVQQMQAHGPTSAVYLTPGCSCGQAFWTRISREERARVSTGLLDGVTSEKLRNNPSAAGLVTRGLVLHRRGLQGSSFLHNPGLYLLEARARISHARGQGTDFES